MRDVRPVLVRTSIWACQSGAVFSIKDKVIGG